MSTLDDLNPVADYTTNANWGAGTYEQVAGLELETDVLKGDTTQYPQSGVRPEEYGEPTRFATKGVGYNLYIIEGTATEPSPTPVEQHIYPRRILLAIPSTGTTPETSVKKVLGL
jgi:hypothetical protein